MTPFGIRKKLKSLLGLGGASGAGDTTPKEKEVPSFQVTFVLPDGSSYDARAKEGDTLVMSSNRGPSPIATGCARRHMIRNFISTRPSCQMSSGLIELRLNLKAISALRNAS